MALATIAILVGLVIESEVSCWAGVIADLQAGQRNRMTIDWTEDLRMKLSAY